MSTAFYKFKLVDGNELAVRRIEGNNDWEPIYFSFENYLNCTFYNEDINRYQTNLINKELVENLHNKLQSHLLKFCGNPLKNKKTSAYGCILPMAVVSVGGIMSTMFILKKLFIQNTDNENSSNKLLAIEDNYPNEGLTKKKSSAATFFRLPYDVEREAVKVENLIQNCSSKANTSAQAEKLNFMNKADSHGNGSQDDTICNYTNSRNILAKPLN